MTPRTKAEVDSREEAYSPLTKGDLSFPSWIARHRFELEFEFSCLPESNPWLGLVLHVILLVLGRVGHLGAWVGGRRQGGEDKEEGQEPGERGGSILENCSIL